MSDDDARSFASFRDSLRDALVHLHTPGFRAPGILLEVTGCDASGGPAALQSSLLTGIGELEPCEDAPASSRLRRAYESLHDRYVLGLTQEETAERLSVSVRHLQRIQVEAVHLLARHLWQSWRAANEPADDLDGRAVREVESGQAPDWRTQADRELASLTAYAPEPSGDVCATVESVLELERAVLERRSVSIALAGMAPDLVAAGHPAAIRQALIAAISRLTHGMSGGRVLVRASMDGGVVRVSASAPLDAGEYPSEDELVRDLILPAGASATAHRGRRRIRVELGLPALDHRSVAVVEDNLDMVVFYRHCAAGMPYRVIHVEPGSETVAKIEDTAPDAVVLDVMMPHVDGWQVLTHLRALPTTRGIPIIVCSVVKERELALALGAACFLAKPVSPREFVSALNGVLDPGRQAVARDSG